jgi:hypothetical protein
MALPLAWLDITVAARWWLATASRAAHATEQRQSSMSDGEEVKWESPPPAVPTCGIRSASPHGMTAAGSVRSPSCHRAWCRKRMTDVAG